MEDIIKIRKDKVKNVAIVFLSVMLVLTFFSNSILNRALPEVATASVEYNTITERVRGTGIVEANDPYKVVCKDTRTIESVAVKVGDMVTKDQVLFYLEDKESEELKTIEKELDDLILNYTTAILSGDISNDAFHNIQNDNIAGVTAYQAQIEAARQKVNAAQDKVDDINRQIISASMESGEQIDITKDIAIAEAGKETAAARKSEAQTRVDSIQAQINSLEAKMAEVLGEPVAEGSTPEVGIAKINNKLVELEGKIAGSEAGSVSYYKTKKSELTEGALKQEIPETTDPNTGELVPAVPGMTDSQIAAYFSTDVNGFPIMNKMSVLEEEAVKRGGNSGKTQYETMMDAYMQYLDIKDKKDAVQEIYNAYFNLPNQLSAAKRTLADATDDYDDYVDEIEDLSEDSAEYAGDKTAWQNALKLNLADAEKELESAKEEQTQLLLDVSKELDLSNQNSIIAEKKQELEELRAKATGSTIAAPVEGTVISIDKTAGESTVPEEAVATIQITGKGMTVKFSVTNAQAAKVSVGDKAELQNAWYYDDVMVTLNKIKPDPDDPGKKKLLEFTVEGSVSNGESLSLSVGERSAEYEHVVPNSAVREDNNGKFIFIIEEKSTPFGNRYKAKRVDVEVLASDEVNTAVSAELQGYEYVITTSNQPVEAGDQVRLNG